MTNTQRPLAALAGVAFCLLGIAGTLVVPSDPGFAAPPGELAAYYVANDDAILGGATLYLLGGAFLLVFAGYLRTALTAAGERLAATAYSGGIAGAALAMGATSLQAGAALRVSEQGTISPDVAAVAWDGSNMLYGYAAPAALAVLVLSVAVAARRTGLLHTWHVALSVVLGAALLLPMVSHMAIIVFGFWSLVTGGLLYLGAGARRPVAGTVPASA